MCVYSLVQESWTVPFIKPDIVNPNYIPWTPTSPDPLMAQQMLDILRRLDEIDKRLGLLDCKETKKSKRNFKRKLERRAAKSRMK